MTKAMDEIEVWHEGAVTVIRINRPTVRNAINYKTAVALREAWLRFDSDTDARVGVITGGDTVFCAGADLGDLDSLAREVEGDNGPLGFTRLFVHKPTIAAVGGYCVAGGLEIACWCDLRIADETAIFGCYERRFGVPLVDGGTQRLPRIVGLGRALDLILTGRSVSVYEALSMGLVNEVTAAGESLKRAVEIGQQLASFPPAALTNDRQAVYDGLGKDLHEGLSIEAKLGTVTLNSGEARAGATRFLSGSGRRGKFD